MLREGETAEVASGVGCALVLGAGCCGGERGT